MKMLLHRIAWVLSGVLLVSSGTVFAQSDEDESQNPSIKIQQTTLELEARAKAIADAFREKGMVELTEKMGARVRGAFGIIDSEALREKEPVANSIGAFRAILFASQSVPLETLRAYAAQLEKANGVIVFRGIPGGISKIQPIVELTHKIILRDPVCKGEDCAVFDVGVIVDPLMFRANGIDRVPAVTIVDHDPFAAYCERPDEELAGSISSFVTYGDAHLSGHLAKLEKLGDKRARSLLIPLQSSGDVR